jgi:hypothetical protein
MKSPLLFFAVLASAGVIAAASEPPRKVEVPHPFYWAKPDPLRGDWVGQGGYVAQVVRTSDRILSVPDQLAQPEDEGKYEAMLYRQFNVPNEKPLAVLHGVKSGDRIDFAGDDWTGKIEAGHFQASKGAESFDLERRTDPPPSLGAKPPPGAIVLFDGKDMNAWGKMESKDWLKEAGPSGWRLVEDGVLEAVPGAGSIISHQWFGDATIHVEFRTLGGPTNSGVYVQDRYEANINEMYGRYDGNPNGGFDNCTPKGTSPGIRCSRPPLEWQTMDIEFTAPRFDSAGHKTASARATLRLNGVLIYDHRELGPLLLNAAKLGEAPKGPIQLQEHSMPVQFRNIWVVDKTAG